jgi:hypothetical protein
MAHALAIGLGAIRSMSRNLFKSEQAQDTFEYVIIIGVVVVAVIAAVVTPIGSNLINFVTGATSTAVSELYT